MASKACADTDVLVGVRVRMDSAVAPTVGTSIVDSVVIDSDTHVARSIRRLCVDARCNRDCYPAYSVAMVNGVDDGGPSGGLEGLVGQGDTKGAVTEDMVHMLP